MLKLFNKYVTNTPYRPITPIYKHPNHLYKNDLLYNKFTKNNLLSLKEKFKLDLAVDSKKDDLSNNISISFILLIAITAFVIYKRQNVN